LAVQFLAIYGLLALAGLRLARARNREPAPLLTALWANERPDRFVWSAAGAFTTGLLCGLAVFGTIVVIKRALPQTLPDVLHPPSFWGALLASATASFGEEILCRLFILSALLRILPASSNGTAIAVAISSLLFAVLHAPAAVFLFGGSTRFHPSLGSGWFHSMRLSALCVPRGISALALAVQSSYTLQPIWCGTCCPNCPERRTRCVRDDQIHVVAQRH
jgi:membrane protease YdiL (CAAX protease family)